MNTEEKGKRYMYRYDNCLVSNGVDEFDEPLGSHMHVSMARYLIIKETPKGFWIAYSPSMRGKKFVLKESNKRFACLTKEAAAESFVARKQKQIKILKHQIKDAEDSLYKLNSVLKREAIPCPTMLTSALKQLSSGNPEPVTLSRFLRQC